MAFHMVEGFSRSSKVFPGVSGNMKEVSKAFWGCFGGVSGAFQRRSRGFQGHF